ncbi:hypothetical protein GV819_11700 [Pseudomonas sp. Fl5BN2]|uniref:hypothetical protein n=1 Tax=unclassified Pseudomonas TaxID=196821 RepID=UPI00137812AA|nr:MULTISPECIES: hypothetical protein [unclassified Pseudomonas]NBF02952.1 hypothetical protein [Pseudomonas sp. Fl5BN2]NBF11706.1 hypothetical protein [Pseudomonas sp. Fl4BN1]
MSDDEGFFQGRLTLNTAWREMRMSHWIASPRLVECGSGRVLLDLHGSLWDLLSSHESADALDLSLRRYPGDQGALTLRIKAADFSLWLGSHPLAPADVEVALDAALQATPV